MKNSKRLDVSFGEDKPRVQLLRGHVEKCEGDLIGLRAYLDAAYLGSRMGEAALPWISS